MGHLRLLGGRRFDGQELVANQEHGVDVHSPEDMVVQLNETSLIVPGLLDVHCHLAALPNGTGIPPEACLQSGVLAAADAGSYGVDEWDRATSVWLEHRLRIRAWLFLLPGGLHGAATVPSSDEVIDSARVASRSPMFLGIKVRLGQGNEAYDRSLLALADAVRAELDCRLLVHLTGTELDLDEVVDHLRSGDILSHTYHGRRGSIRSEQGGLRPAIHRARRVGVLLDVAHGSNHFAWKTFEAARAEGVKPDLISTDLTLKTLGQSPVYDLPFVLSKVISAGMDICAALQAVTTTPASIMNYKLGATDIVVLEDVRESVRFVDAEGESRAGDRRYRAGLVVTDGDIVTEPRAAPK